MNRTLARAAHVGTDAHIRRGAAVVAGRGSVDTSAMTDQGFFGPDSVSWRVHREVTVLFGGARALLMQASHPLVIAGARETGFYQSVHGVDEVTGKTYDAFDPDLLLWVHACLVDSALLFERHTVGRLDDAGRQRFHEEQMAAAELLELSRERIPP